MGNGYRINIAHNGRHLFATEPESIWTKEEAKRIYTILKEKFPESEGYNISVTCWESIGKQVEF